MIGKETKNKNILYDIKRLIVRNYNYKKIQEDMKYWAFKIIKNENNRPLFEVEYNGKIVIFILKKF